MLRKALFLPLILLLTSLGFAPPNGPQPQDAPPDVCQSAENILSNCHFDNGAAGWVPYTEDGSASFSILQGGGECHAPLCPAGYIVTESTFVGGIYQQVPVAKGNTYFANIVWLSFDSLNNDAGINATVGGIGRRMGLDPFGGTDPRSPNVVWGPENWRNDCKICANQEVTATAQADTMTVFLRLDDRWRQRAAEKGFSVPPSKDQFWLDDLGLKQVGGDAAPPPPTDTPAPPTDTPAPPTDTPTPEAPVSLESAPTEEVQAAAAEAATEESAASLESASTEEAQPNAAVAALPESPVATPIPAPVIAPPPTLTPSATPSPTPIPAETEEKRPRPTATTRTRRATPIAASASALMPGMMGLAGTTVCMGGLGLVLMGGVLGGLVWLFRLGWGKPGDAPDDEEEIEVEIIDDHIKR